MANSQIDPLSTQTDRLSSLPDALLVTILSFLSTRIAARRTSVLSRRFRHLWEASPNLALISIDLPHPQSEKFVAMAKHAFLGRNPSHSLLSLRLEVFHFDHDASFLSSLFTKARSLDLRHLTFVGCLSENLLPILPIIFTINSLSNTPKLDVVLSLPSLESLHLEIWFGLQSLTHIHVEVPLLRKAVINLYDLHMRDVSAVAGLLNCISHVEELTLHLKESEDVKYPIPILLESGKNVPKFSNLKHLHLSLCFHELNFEAVTTMLHNCPVLESLKLVHEIPKFIYSSRARKRRGWASRLPCNADGNCHYAYFKNLHLGEDNEKFMKLLSKKCTS